MACLVHILVFKYNDKMQMSLDHRRRRRQHFHSGNSMQFVEDFQIILFFFCFFSFVGTEKEHKLIEDFDRIIGTNE